MTRRTRLASGAAGYLLGLFACGVYLGSQMRAPR